jgi:hypothetical protein
VGKEASEEIDMREERGEREEASVLETKKAQTPALKVV